MDAIVGALTDQQHELSALLDGLDEQRWRLPSPCEGWSVADVVLHLAQTNELAIGSATGRYAEALAELGSGLGAAASVDEGADLMVARDRSTSPYEVRQRWETGAEELRRALEACAPATRVTWVAGQLSARTLATTRLAETWIHTGDVATALGQTLEPTERLWHIARLAWRTLPYAFARAGQQLTGDVSFHLTGPGGETWDFPPDSTPAATTITGDALELCLVAGRRLPASDTSLRGDGPDADGVLDLVRTYA